jgi:hypothetical protein
MSKNCNHTVTFISPLQRHILLKHSVTYNALFMSNSMAVGGRFGDCQNNAEKEGND